MNQEQIISQLAVKRLETTMIGALARFENVFGYLWGHHKNIDEPLSESEIHFDNMWQDVRNNILNHGNQQIRAITDDISRNLRNGPDVKFNYKFKVKPLNKENDNAN
jgi:hypothetical protein